MIRIHFFKKNRLDFYLAYFFIIKKLEFLVGYKNSEVR